MKRYVKEKTQEEIEKDKKKKKQKKDTPCITKKDYGLTENAKILLE